MGSLAFGDAWSTFAGAVAPVFAQYTDHCRCRTVWSHPRMQDEIPDDGHVVDLIPRIAPTLGFQQKLRVENPMRLYWAE